MLKGGNVLGFRYRKSINLGGGCRINLSKSGIGYSWGTKGYRVTRTAKGKTRRTISIPGTGISWVKETRKKDKLNNNKNNPEYNLQYKAPIDSNHYMLEKIANGDASAMQSEGLENMLATVNKTLTLNKVANISFWITLVMSLSYPWFIILLCASIILKIYVKTKGLINLDYVIDEDQEKAVATRMSPMIKVTKSNKVWRIMETSRVINSKYSAGANNSVNLTICKTTTKPPFPFKTDIQVASFKAGKETLLFLPDKLFIIQGTKIGALNYTDIKVNSYTTRFIERDSLPRDATVVGNTWEYTNKSGGPDRRFKNNRPIPVCLYGIIELQSASGLNIVTMFSNINIK